MSLTNPPSIITTLSTQLAACASWTGSTTNHWYPIAPDGTTPPFAVLQCSVDRRQTYAASAPSLPGGTLIITIYDSSSNRTIGQLQDFCRTIHKELMDQATTIPFRDGDGAELSDIQGAMEAAESGALRSVSIVLEYGINA